MRLTAKQVTWLKVCLHLAGFLPFVWLMWAINHGGLSADPVKDIQHFTGRTALKFLLATLLVTPLARYAKQPLLIRTRRLLGLWCFAWATLHLTSYALLELGVNNLTLLGQELITRPYLTLGIISWLILLALTFTSTQAMQRNLGKRWQQLHNFVYLVAILAPIHYLWSVKIISMQSVIYAVLVLLLLGLRHNKWFSLFKKLQKLFHHKITT
ncbi:protein-methionine-sulfoxide reductase heme-binding subunit MsrQ [Escherichia albertii]|nr:protein-methionine-sulfoxide reductase heme-binding subunit MsrQ [Escherichia albertii]EHX2146132.1 protein-methionine-sulfoxide reductase heme-binding subunit MsrQ [Escherichia albertii]EJJ6392189.1 protein-methionine-sulfoxide reductase heme-binding subunit MsrQ [Escherichia albertii]EKB0157196.1 protein-methionine-sulfoxide reductase heme-binding subunit MsrQ [Escherichia albertii]EKD4815497.1 protein-methionine-sulfoxide reductase heme-binding subunit MsrQ [Escherichia albertii]